MRKFTKIVAPALIAALGIGAAAIPAQAAPYAHQHNTHSAQHSINQHAIGRPTATNQSNIRSEINSLKSQIKQAEARRTISKSQATKLKRDVSEVQRLYTSYARNGLTRNETNTLQNRVDRIKSALRVQSRNNRR